MLISDEIHESWQCKTSQVLMQENNTLSIQVRFDPKKLIAVYQRCLASMPRLFIQLVILYDFGYNNNHACAYRTYECWVSPCDYCFSCFRFCLSPVPCSLSFTLRNLPSTILGMYWTAILQEGGGLRLGNGSSLPSELLRSRHRMGELDSVSLTQTSNMR